MDALETKEVDLSQHSSAAIIPDLKEILQFRLSIYNFLGFIFYNKLTYEELKSNQLNQTIRLLVDHGLGYKVPGVQELQGFLQEAKSEEICMQLRQDFQALFEGPGKLLAPPWESVYLSEEHLMFEQQTMEVREIYRRYGLQIENYGVEPDDHIGLELQFMSFLAAESVRLVEHDENQQFMNMIQAQEHFLQEHLLEWVDQFTELVELGAKTSLYKGLAGFLPWFLENDAAFLSSFKTDDLTK